MKKILKTKTLLIVSAGVLIFGVLISSLPLLWEKFTLGRVPDNSNFSVPSQLKPEEIISGELGGGDYSELIYDKNLDGQRWLVPCYSAIEVDDAQDVCKSFAKGYLRKYSTYKLLDGNIVGGSYKIIPDVEVPAKDGGWTTIIYEDEKLRGNYSLLINILEYYSSDDAKSACAFFVVDASYKMIQMNDVNILTEESEENNWARYVLLADKTMISIQGDRAAVRDAMGAIVEKYKK